MHRPNVWSYPALAASPTIAAQYIIDASQCRGRAVSPAIAKAGVRKSVMEARQSPPNCGAIARGIEISGKHYSRALTRGFAKDGRRLLNTRPSVSRKVYDRPPFRSSQRFENFMR